MAPLGRGVPGGMWRVHAVVLINFVGLFRTGSVSLYHFTFIPNWNCRGS
jgi:hypothetical protein